MVQACRVAFVGQLAALMVLVGTEVVSMEPSGRLLALQLACGAEALGYGVAAPSAARGAMRDAAWVRAGRMGSSGVFAGLAVRHAVLVIDPFAAGPLLTAAGTWVIAVCGWMVMVFLLGGQRPPEATWRQRLTWLAVVAATGGVNTLAMAAVRAAV